MRDQEVNTVSYFLSCSDGEVKRLGDVCMQTSENELYWAEEQEQLTTVGNLTKIILTPNALRFRDSNYQTSVYEILGIFFFWGGGGGGERAFFLREGG